MGSDLLPCISLARWWSKIYGRSIQSLKIIHQAGKENLVADALSHSPHAPAHKETVGEREFQVAQVINEDVSVSELLSASTAAAVPVNYGFEKRKDKQLVEIINFS